MKNSGFRYDSQLGQQPEVQPYLREGERRRSQRALLVIPVNLTWATEDGVRVTEQAQTEEINAHGALLRMKSCLPTSMEVELSHPRTHQSTRARVVGTRHPEPDGSVRVAVELAVPSETFWGVSFPTLVGTASR